MRVGELIEELNKYKVDTEVEIHTVDDEVLELDEIIDNTLFTYRSKVLIVVKKREE